MNGPDIMQLLSLLLPYVTAAFAAWCVVGVLRTAVEIWTELRSGRDEPGRTESIRPAHRPDRVLPKAA